MVEIGGKEVKSIVLQDGGVLYREETSITLTSDTNIVSTGETATIIATLNPSAEDKTIVFTIGEEEQASVSIPGQLSTLHGFDINTDIGSIRFDSKSDSQGKFIRITKVMDNISILAGKSETFNSYNIKYGYEKIHLDQNNVIVYEYTDSSRTETKMTDIYNYFLSRGYISEIDLSQWNLAATSSVEALYGIKNTGVYATTDSNGQATMEYEGVGAGDITIKGTYIDKNISNTITILDSNIPSLYLTSEKDSIKKGETTLLTTSFSIPQENETIYLNKIIDDENLNLELTSTQDGLNHIIKAKVTDENDNGLGNINIKLFKEEW